MKSTKKKLLAFLTVLSITVMSIAMPVCAGNGPNPDPENSYAWILVQTKDDSDGVYLYSAPDPASVSKVDGISYDKSINTLTLNNFNDPTKRIVTNEMGDDFTIMLNGVNHIQQIYAWGFGYGGSVSLKGTGKLVINENKQERTPIYLQAEGAAARFTVASGVALKAYSQPKSPTVYIDQSTASSEGIVFEGNDDMNQNVEKEKHQYPKSCTAYRADKKIQLNPCTPKDTSDTATYGGVSYLMEVDGKYVPYYKIFEIFEDSEIGKIASLALNSEGEPVSADDYVIDESYTDCIEAIDTDYPSYLGIYTKDGESVEYGCYAYSTTSDGVNFESFYSMYRLRQIEIGTFTAMIAIPIDNEHNLSEMPDGYTSAPGNVYYYYNYNEEIIDLNGTATAPTDPTKPTQPTAPTVTVCKHTTTKLVRKKAATYFATGYTGDRVCKKDGTVVSKGKTIAKLKLKVPKLNVKGAQKQIKVTYKKISGATGFQVRYKIDKGKWKVKTYNVNKNVTKFIQKLKKGNYKVQLRSFVMSGKQKAYSTWTITETVKVK